MVQEYLEGRSVRGLPSELQRIVRKALAKDPELRYQSAGDAVVDLKMLAGEVDAGTAEAMDSSVGAATPAAAPASGVSWGVAGPALVAALVLGALGARYMASAPARAPGMPARFEIELPGESGDFDNRDRRVLAIAPDGSRIAFTYGDLLWVRPIDELAAAPLRNTVNARSPAFSPDGQQIVFIGDDNQVKRIAVTGGAAVTVGRVDPERRPGGLHWAADGYIYAGGFGAGIVRLPETGGAPETVVEADGAVADNPWLLPGGGWLLYARASGPRAWNDAQIVAHSLTDGQERVLVEGGTAPRFVDTGHLLYVRDGVLYALRFDPERIAVVGGPVALIEQVRTAIAARTGAAHLDLSASGDLVYVRGAGSAAGRSLLAFWVDRPGDQEALPFEPRGFGTMSLSADDRRLAVEEREAEGSHIWLYDTDRAGGQRLTTEGSNFDPVWTPDGEWVYFSSIADSEPDIWRRRANLSAPAELVYDGDNPVFPWSISNDGAWLLFHERSAAGGEIGRLSLDGEANAELLVSSPANEVNPTFSPDGRYFAYQSNESGRPEIYVRDIETGERWLISTEGGFLPRWAHEGAEIFYLWASSIWAVTVETDPELTYGQPQRLEWLGTSLNYEVDATGERTIQLRDADA